MDYEKIMESLEVEGNKRQLPRMFHSGKYVETADGRMLNLSSNDYLGISADNMFTEAFLEKIHKVSSKNGYCQDLLFSSTSSRLLTGNYDIYDRLEARLATMFGAGAALVFSSGYLMNSGILPAVTDASTLILADKLVHASIIDGIRLSSAASIRFRHGDYEQLEALVAKNKSKYSSIVIVVESVYSMDGDVADIERLVSIKKTCSNVMLYVDEAHAFGVFGDDGLGVVQQQGALGDVDFICGTFGKAAASVGAYLICSRMMKEYLVNRMRTLIFNTALPPVNLLWTLEVLDHFEELKGRREHLHGISGKLRNGLLRLGLESPSRSQIIPVMAGQSKAASELASAFQKSGFYLLPVRPPTVPEGTSRLRISLTAAVTDDEVASLLDVLSGIIGDRKVR